MFCFANLSKTILKIQKDEEDFICDEYPNY